MFFWALITAQLEVPAMQAKINIKQFFCFNLAHYLWELRWNFLFSSLSTMIDFHSLQMQAREELQGNYSWKETKKQEINLRVMQMAWKTCQWYTCREGVLWKGNHSSPIPFWSECTEQWGPLGEPQHKPALQQLLDPHNPLHHFLGLCAWTETEMLSLLRDFKWSWKESHFAKEWYFSMYKYFN